MMAPDETVPDLLRRFTPTPHHLNLVLMDIPLTLQTNDPDLFGRMKIASQQRESHESTLLVKVIRDYDAVCEAMETTLLSAEPLTTVIIGGQSLIVLDCERHEILGFLSPSVSSDLFVFELLPLLLARFSGSWSAYQSLPSMGDSTGFSQKSDNSEIAP